ncbi:FUSC family protein [Streptomyces sp. NPDC059989]|uniref:FUSC family protein n=1 Tax=Streptomyces sp. NPDC059989 TaxID=3347026 RepID=UPI0036B1C3DD
MRVTLVASAGFYLFLYGFDSTVGATYALFGTVALAGLSRIPGTGPQRATLVLRLIPACWLLVVIGTYLSVRTWSAVAGMLVVGFVLAFAAVGGPRPAGAGPGLQLLYILPSFPPYDPDSLGERLIGTTVGLVLLVLAERYVFPEPPTTPYRELAARAAETAGRCARELTGPPYAPSGAVLGAAREASTSLRLPMVPEADRPAGPGVRERALAHTGLAARTLLSRLVRLPGAPGGGGPDILRGVERLAERTAEGLRRRATEPGEAYEGLVAARAQLAGMSAEPAAPAVLRHHAAVLEVADAALAMATAADIAVRGRAAAGDVEPGRFWYARMRAPQLWWHRIEGHAGQRSVFFQNAVRISLALTAARLVAGLDTLPHGFWAMLATLTITRTTAVETWSTVRVALAGTFLGALFTAVMLTLAGNDTAVYAAVLPVWMLFAFTVGPVRGVGWAQGLFTVLVALVFVQLAPATWKLAELRLLDVLIGSTIGAVFGILAWPRGAHDEMGRAAAGLLRRAAEIVVATSTAMAAGGVREQSAGNPGQRSLRHALVMAESAYAQFQSEPTRSGDGDRAPPDSAGQRHGADWQSVLMVGHHTLWGSDRLLAAPPPVPGEPGRVVVPPLGAEAAAAVTRLGDRVAGRMLLVSARLDPGGDTPAAPVPLRDPEFDGFAAEPEGARRPYYATVSWLDALMTDLERITAADTR